MKLKKLREILDAIEKKSPDGEVDVVYDESDAALQELYNRPILAWSNNVRRT